MVDNCWDRAAPRYLDFWVPRLIPYHEDLVQKAAPKPGERVLVTAAGPGLELIPISRAMQGQGVLAATDPSEKMSEQARKVLAEADIGMHVDYVCTDASDTLKQNWDLIVNAFGLWQLKQRHKVLRGWREALSEGGRVAILAWGPPDPEGPFEMLESAFRDLEPEAATVTRLRELAGREAMGEILAESGLRMVRHAVVRNAMEFGSAEGFLDAMCSGCSLVQIAEALGRERLQRVAQAFYAKLTPASARTPLLFAPSASIAIAEPA
jgi:ubiquinone/menaquinone biosynthesis C-methylase UbiE